MSNGGNRLKELIKKRGFILKAVAEAIDVDPQTITRWTNNAPIGVNPNTMARWTDNAPIGKLIKLSRFTGIPILEVIGCFEVEDESASTAS